MSPTVDFFISYTHPDEPWAEWIAWQLEEAGCTTRIQAWDFVGGRNFILQMDEAARAERTIAVLTPAYLESDFAAAEWAAALRTDPRGVHGRLLPVRVAACNPTGLLASLTYIDLVGADEATARDRLFARIADRAKPAVAPAFPGGAAPPPTFPIEAGGRTEVVSAPAPSAAHEGSLWIKLDDAAFPIEQLEDDGRAVEFHATPSDPEVTGTLDSLDRGLASRGVRLVYGNRVLAGRVERVTRSVTPSGTRFAVRLVNVEPVSGSPLRAGTSGYSADDLVERGMRHLFLGEPLPDELGALSFMTDPGLDGNSLRAAYHRGDDAEPLVRLLVVEGLVGSGHASAVVELAVGPKVARGREIAVAWDEPRVYANVEPKRRRLEGWWVA